MRQKRSGGTNAVVAAGMGTAVAVVLSMLGLYIPIISTAVFLMIPLPIAYIGLTHGARWSVLSAAAALLLDSVLFGVFSGAFLCAIFTCLGVALGVCYRRRARPAATLFAGAGAVLVAFSLQILFGIYVLGMDTSILDGTFMETIRASTEEILPQFYSGETLAAAQAGMEQTYEMLRKSVLFIAATVCVIYSWAAMTLSKYIFLRMGYKNIPVLPPVSRWELPVQSVYLYLIFFGLGYLYPEDPANNFLYNLQMMCHFVFWLRGLAFLWWLPVRFPVMKSLRWFIAGGAFFLPFLQQAMVVMGLFDLLFRYRKKKNYE